MNNGNKFSQKAKPILTLENSGAKYGVENSAEGQENFYSPNNFGTEGDLAFYSPISSKSVSPERSDSPIKRECPFTRAFCLVLCGACINDKIFFAND